MTSSFELRTNLTNNDVIATLLIKPHYLMQSRTEESNDFFSIISFPN